ncbi:hypothetical protein ACTFIR_009285 [Dictyostelium discoideum]
MTSVSSSDSRKQFKGSGDHVFDFDNKENHDFLSLTIKQDNNNNNNNNTNISLSPSIKSQTTSSTGGNKNQIFSQMRELDKKSLMLIETYYRDKLITYQEKLKRELEQIYNKKLQSLKIQYDSDSYLKFKQFELETKKALLLLLKEFQDLKKSKQQQEKQLKLQQIKQESNNNNNDDDQQKDIDNSNNIVNDFKTDKILKEKEEILNKLELITKSITDLFIQQVDISTDTIDFQSFLSNIVATTTTTATISN